MNKHLEVSDTFTTHGGLIDEHTRQRRKLARKARRAVPVSTPDPDAPLTVEQIQFARLEETTRFILRIECAACKSESMYYTSTLN